MSKLAVELVRALFCGLPRKKFRMAVFIAAGDESADQNPKGAFFYGGFAAPLDIWEGVFSEAWNERVLNGPPRIPYLHMTDILSPQWREDHGLRDFEARLDEASRVIRSTGSLIPVLVSVDENDFNATLRLPFKPKPNRKAGTLEPDYICYICFAYAQLQWLYEFRKDAERVDFWVEKGPLTKYINGFHKTLAGACEYVGSPHLVPLIGDMLPVGKERIPAQAADMLGWHARNKDRGTLDPSHLRRYGQMVEWGKRSGFKTTISSDLLKNLAGALAKRAAEE